MKIKLALLAALLVAFGSAASAQSETAWSRTQAAEELARAVSDAFDEKDLGRLDAERPYLRSVRIRVEHSISGRTVTRSFRTLEAAERWLRRGRSEDLRRNGGTLRQCRRGVCAFEQEGMLHNNLYLNRITFGVRKGRPYIKAIHLTDGD